MLRAGAANQVNAALHRDDDELVAKLRVVRAHARLDLVGLDAGLPRVFRRAEDRLRNLRRRRRLLRARREISTPAASATVSHVVRVRLLIRGTPTSSRACLSASVLRRRFGRFACRFLLHHLLNLQLILRDRAIPSRRGSRRRGGPPSRANSGCVTPSG